MPALLTSAGALSPRPLSSELDHEVFACVFSRWMTLAAELRHGLSEQCSNMYSSKGDPRAGSCKAPRLLPPPLSNRTIEERAVDFIWEALAEFADSADASGNSASDNRQFDCPHESDSADAGVGSCAIHGIQCASPYETTASDIVAAAPTAPPLFLSQQDAPNLHPALSVEKDLTLRSDAENQAMQPSVIPLLHFGPAKILCERRYPRGSEQSRNSFFDSPIYSGVRKKLFPISPNPGPFISPCFPPDDTVNQPSNCLNPLILTMGDEE